MLLPDVCSRVRPSRIARRQREKPLGRAQLEHEPHLAQFLGEFAGEALERPASARPPLEKPKLAEAVEVIADRRRRDPKLAREFEPVDLLARLAVAVEDPLHEPLFDDGAKLLRFHVGVEVCRRGAAQKHLAPAVLGQGFL